MSGGGAGDPRPGGTAASWRAGWRRWTRGGRLVLLLAAAAVALRLLVPPGRALFGDCRPAVSGDALMTGLTALSLFVVAWAVAGLTSWAALRRPARVVQVGAAIVAAANAAAAIACR